MMVSKHEIKFCSYSNTEILGLGDMQVAGKSLFSVEVVSAEAELFHLDSLLFKKYFDDDSKVKENCKKYVRTKKRFIIERLGKLKATKVTFFDKFRTNEVKKQVVMPTPKKQPKTFIPKIEKPKPKVFPVFHFDIKDNYAEQLKLHNKNKVQSTFYHLDKINKIEDDEKAVDYYLKHFDRMAYQEKCKKVNLEKSLGKVMKNKAVDPKEEWQSRTATKIKKEYVIDMLAHEKLEEVFNTTRFLPDLNKRKIDLLLGNGDIPVLFEETKKEVPRSIRKQFGFFERPNNIFRDRHRILRMQTKRKGDIRKSV